MRTEPYRSASRVFWIVDNGSSHRGHTAVKRLRKVYPRFERHKKRSPSKSGEDRQDSIFSFP
jgi:hypothetical protein